MDMIQLSITRAGYLLGVSGSKDGLTRNGRNGKIIDGQQTAGMNTINGKPIISTPPIPGNRRVGSISAGLRKGSVIHVLLPRLIPIRPR